MNTVQDLSRLDGWQSCSFLIEDETESAQYWTVRVKKREWCMCLNWHSDAFIVKWLSPNGMRGYKKRPITSKVRQSPRKTCSLGGIFLGVIATVPAETRCEFGFIVSNVLCTEPLAPQSMAEEVTLSHNSPFISLRYTLQHHLHDQCAFWFEVDSAAGSSHGLQIGIDRGIPHLMHEFGIASLISGSHGTICRCIEHLWPWNSSGYGSNLGWGLNILTKKSG